MSACLLFSPERIDELHRPIREDLAAFRSHEIALHDRAVASAPDGAGGRQVRARPGQLDDERLDAPGCGP